MTQDLELATVALLRPMDSEGNMEPSETLALCPAHLEEYEKRVLRPGERLLIRFGALGAKSSNPCAWCKRS